MTKLYFLLTVFFLGSCSQKIVPAKPEAVAMLPEPKSMISSFEVPVSINLEKLNSFVESQIPTNLYAGQEQGTQKMNVNLLVGTVTKEYNWEVQYSVVKTGKITLSIDNAGVLWFRIPLKVNANGCASVFLGTEFKKCGSASPEIDLIIKSKVGLNPNWTFNSKTFIAYDLKKTVVNIPFALGDFPLFSLKLDIKNDLQKPIDQNLNQISKEIDVQIVKYLNSLKLKERADQAWQKLSKNFQVSTHPPLFLNFDPKAITISDLYPNQQSLEAIIGIQSVLEINSKPIEKEKGPLPAINKGKKLINSAHINLPITIDYLTIANLLKENFADTVFESDHYRFKANDIRMSGDGSQVLIEIDYQAKLSGIMKNIVGIMYVKAIPAFDTLTNTFYLKECRLTTETNSSITNKGFNNFANKTITNSIKKMTTYSLNKDIENIKNQFNKQVNDSKFGLFEVKGSVNDIKFLNFFVEKDQITINLKAVGNLSTSVDFTSNSLLF